MLRPLFTGQFKRDYKLALRRGCDRKRLEAVIDLLCREEELPPAYRDHALVNSRNYKGMRECHIPAGLALSLSNLRCHNSSLPRASRGRGTA